MRSSKVHLIEKQRDQIEIMLNESKNLNEIAFSLGRDPRGIQKEIIKHRKLYIHGKRKNICGNQEICRKVRICNQCSSGKCKYCSVLNCNDFCEEFTNEPNCKTCKRFPYVCNGCSKIKDCFLPKYYYKAKTAQEEYIKNVSQWKKRTKFSEIELKKIDEIVKEGTNKGHSIDVIVNKSKLNVSTSTIYRWIENKVLTTKNIDLKRKVRYKPRITEKPKAKPLNYNYLNGRKFEDFQEYFLNNPSSNIWQMDTIEGIKGKSATLSLLHTKSNLQLFFKIPRKTQAYIISVFENIKKHLSPEIFKEIFECILTDNGTEFMDPLSIEIDSITGEILTKIFYCEPRRSDQKGKCEKNHEHFREFIPKGLDMDPFDQKDMDYISLHVNNYPRKVLNYNSPFEVFSNLELNKKTFEFNNLKHLISSKVILKRFIK